MAASTGPLETPDIYYDIKEERQSADSAAGPSPAVWRWPSAGGLDTADSVRTAGRTASWSWASAASEPLPDTDARQPAPLPDFQPAGGRRRLHVQRADAVAAAASQPLEAPQQQQQQQQGWQRDAKHAASADAILRDRQPGAHRSQQEQLPAARIAAKRSTVHKHHTPAAAQAPRADASNQSAQPTWGSANSGPLFGTAPSPMQPSHAQDAWHWPEDDTDEGAAADVDEHAAAMRANAEAAAAARANAAAAARAARVLQAQLAGTGARRVASPGGAATAARRAAAARPGSAATSSSSISSGLPHQQRQQQQQQQQQRRVHFAGEVDERHMAAARHRTSPAQLPSPRDPKRPRVLGTATTSHSRELPAAAAPAAAGTATAGGAAQQSQRRGALVSQPRVPQPLPPPAAAAAAAAAAGGSGRRTLQAAAWVTAAAAALGGPFLADVGGAAQDTYEETILPIGGAIWSAADVISALVRRAVLPVAGLVLLVFWRLVAVLLRWMLRVVRGGAAAAEVPLVGTMPGMQQRRQGWLWGGRSARERQTVALPELVLGRSRREWLWGFGRGGAEAGTAAALVAAGRNVLAVLPCYVFEELKAATNGYGAAALLPVGSGYGFSAAMDAAMPATSATAGRAAAAAGPAAAAGTVEPGGLALRVPVYVARDVQGMPVAVAVVAVGDEQRLRRFCALAHLLSQLRHPSLLLFMGASVGLAAPRAAYPMVVQRQQGQQEEQRQDAAVGCLVFELLPGVRTLEAALSANSSTAALGSTRNTGQIAKSQTLAADAVPAPASAAAAARGARGTAALDSMPPLSFTARLQVASTLASTVHHLLMRGAVLRPGAAALIDAVLIPQTGPPKINAAALLLLPSTGPQPKASAVVHAQDAQLAAEAAAVLALGHVLLLLLTGPPLALEPDVALLRQVLRRGEAAGLARQATQAHSISSTPGTGAGVRSAGAGGASGGRPAAAAEDGMPQEEQAAGLLEAALLCLSPDGEAAHGSRTGPMAWLPNWLQWRRPLGRLASAGKPRPFPWGQLLPALAALAESAAAPVATAAGRRAGASAPPAMFICPLTHDVMADPVVAADGFVYERAAIQRWLSTGHRRSPMTNVSMATALVPNHSLRSAIMEWRQQQQQQ